MKSTRKETWRKIDRKSFISGKTQARDKFELESATYKSNLLKEE